MGYPKKKRERKDGMPKKHDPKKKGHMNVLVLKKKFGHMKVKEKKGICILI